MKKLVLLFVGLTLISCSKSEDDQNSDDTPFLEKYDGYGFESIGESADEYFFINNSIEFLKYIDIDTREDDNGDDRVYCEIYREGTFPGGEDGDVTISIISNNSTSLTVSVIYGGSETIVTLSVDSTGSTLTVTLNNDEGVDILTFTKTNVIFTSLGCQ